MRQRGATSTKLRGIDAATLLGPATRPLEAAAPVNEPRRTTSSAATRYSPRLGWNRPFRGRSALVPQPASIRASTAQIQGLYPWLRGGTLPPAGAYVGVDVLNSSAFVCHPIEWLRRGLVTNPNILITGIPGAGKSAAIKALALRLMAYGISPLIAGDLKNEYTPLCKALGVEPVELGPGLPARLNPLDAGPLGANLPTDPQLLRERLAEIHRRRTALLGALLVMHLHRELTPTEGACLTEALRESTGEASGASELRDPTIPEVLALLRDPTTTMAETLRVRGNSTTELREMVRPVADALFNMVEGSLGGLFDAPTTVRPDFAAPMQSVDISRLDGRGEELVAMVLACVSSWVQAAIDEPGGRVRMVVRDELWRQVRIPAMVRKVDSDLRLSRAQGTIQVLATHRLSDFEAVGQAGSEEVAIARNLIGSCDTRICLAQDTGPLQMTRDAISLTDTECEIIASFSAAQVGRAVWKVGRNSSHVVQTILSGAEKELFYTNEKMAV
jgi:hypothetical protein